MKGIVQQMQEKKTVKLGEFTKKDFDDLLITLETISKDGVEYRKSRLKEMDSNMKALLKKSKELGKDIPLELAYHCYLSFNKTYVGSDFINKYKEWL